MDMPKARNPMPKPRSPRYPQPRHPDPLARFPIAGVRPEQLRDLLEMRERVIAHNGYVVASVVDPRAGRPEIAHTVGLLERFNHPELIIVGVPIETDASETDVSETDASETDGPPDSMSELILRALADRVARDGLRLAAGETHRSIFPDAPSDETPPPAFPFAVRAVHPERFDPYLLQALLRYGEGQLRALQVVWADATGHFPWDEEGQDRGSGPVSPRAHAQVLLDAAPAPPRGGQDPLPLARTTEDRVREAVAQIASAWNRRLASLDDRTDAIIARHGWMIQGVGASRDPTQIKPSHAYTIGLLDGDHRLRHPELAIVGVGMDESAAILNALGSAVRAGHRFADGETYEGLGGEHPVILRAVHPSRFPSWFGAGLHWGARRLAPDPHRWPYAALQVVLADPDGRFPWADACDPRYRTLQTPLYEPAADHASD
jgi:hypothetical protein